MRLRRTSATLTAAAALAAAAVLAPFAVPAAQARAATPPAPGTAPSSAAASGPADVSREYVQYTIAMDDIEVRGTLDPAALTATNTTSVLVPGTGPRSGWRATPTVSGSLRKGVTSIVNMPPEATGTVRLYAAGDEVRAAVDTTIAGRRSQWDRVLFTL